MSVWLVIGLVIIVLVCLAIALTKADTIMHEGHCPVSDDGLHCGCWESGRGCCWCLAEANPETYREYEDD